MKSRFKSRIAVCKIGVQPLRAYQIHPHSLHDSLHDTIRYDLTTQLLVQPLLLCQPLLGSLHGHCA